MKKILGIVLIAMFGVVVFSACSTQKQACAAYSKVEYKTPAKNS